MMWYGEEEQGTRDEGEEAVTKMRTRTKTGLGTRTGIRARTEVGTRTKVDIRVEG